MQKISIRETLMDFRNALGIYHFSKELTETEFNLISIVTEKMEENENINLSSLSNMLNITRSAVTQIVNKLEKKGYIEKYTLSTNKKEIYLKIGSKAIEQYNKVMDRIVLFFERLFEEVGQEGMENIHKYINVAKKIGKEMKAKGECICCN